MPETDHTTNPFPGLRPFESNETHLFFGRDGQSEELLRRLKRTRFLAVVGTSGSGKSSLVRAGLLPALQGGLMASAGSDWRIAILRPGSDPIGNLARALAHPAVLGPRDEKSDDIQAVMAETTLRRSSLGLVELVSRARAKLDEHGEPLFPDYENLLVVVDQFEELFRFKQLIEEENSKEDAAAFVRLLLEAVGQKAEKIYAVLTMRSDFLGDCSQFWELPEAINNGQYLIPRMTRDERREAISGPVAVGQGAISEPLISQLLNDVGDNPDQLPIMQHALMRTWDHWLTHRNGNPIDIPDYNAIGGMAEALSRHADEAYAELNNRQQAIAEKLFKGLTEKGTDNREIRRPMEVGEICELTGAGEAAVIAVIEVFRREGRSFLMPPPTDALTGEHVHLDRESLIDISHESLIRNWDRLKKWTDEEAQSARIYKRLAETAMLHQAKEEALLVDPALQGALDWREKNNPNAVWAQRYHPEFTTAMDFLDQSVAARDAQAQAREQQRRRETTYKRSRWVLIVLALAFTLSLAALTYARAALSRADKANAEARHQLELATAQANEATAQREAAERQALMANEESTLAKHETKFATQAQQVALQKKHEAELAKAGAIEQKEIAVSAKHEADFEMEKAKDAQRKSQNLLYSADINLVQRAYEAGNIERGIELLNLHSPAAGDLPQFEWFYLWRLLHGEQQILKSNLMGISGETIGSAFSNDGKMVAFSDNSRVELLRLDTKVFARSFQVLDTDLVSSLAFSPDGKVLAVGNGRDSGVAVRFYDTDTVEELASLKFQSYGVTHIFFTPDQKTLITQGLEGSAIKLWTFPSLSEKGSVDTDNRDFALALSPDGKTLVTSFYDPGAAAHPLLLWDLATQKQVGELKGHAAQANLAAFSADGFRLVTADEEGTVRLWLVGIRQEVDNFKPYDREITSLAFSPDARTLVIGYEDGVMKVLETSTSQPRTLVTLRGHEDGVSSMSFTTDSKLLISKSRGKDGAVVKTWDVAAMIDDNTLLDMKSSSQTQLELSPNGRTLAFVPNTGRELRLLDTETRKELPQLEGLGTSSKCSAFSPDGKLIAVGDKDSTVRIWDTGTQTQIGPPIKVDDVNSVAFSPDSRSLAVASLYGTVLVFDVSTRKELARRDFPQGRGRIVQVAFSPDGKRIAILQNYEVEQWDLALSSRFSAVATATEYGTTLSMAFSPSSGALVVGCQRGDILLVDQDRDTPPRSLKGHKGQVNSVAFSKDGKRLVSGGNDGTVKLWDMKSFRELLTLDRHEGAIQSVVFLPDGKTIISSNNNGLRFWRAATEAEVKAKAQSEIK